jgi:hypothetical protein
LQLPQNFFGLTYDYVKYVNEEIYVLVKHGRFSYNDCVNMPVHQRKIFLEKLVEEAEDMQKKQEEALNKNRG